MLSIGQFLPSCPGKPLEPACRSAPRSTIISAHEDVRTTTHPDCSLARAAVAAVFRAGADDIGRPCRRAARSAIEHLPCRQGWQAGPAGIALAGIAWRALPALPPYRRATDASTAACRTRAGRLGAGVAMRLGAAGRLHLRQPRAAYRPACCLAIPARLASARGDTARLFPLSWLAAPSAPAHATHFTIGAARSHARGAAAWTRFTRDAPFFRFSFYPSSSRLAARRLGPRDSACR